MTSDAALLTLLEALAEVERAGSTLLWSAGRLDEMPLPDAVAALSWDRRSAGAGIDTGLVPEVSNQPLERLCLRPPHAREAQDFMLRHAAGLLRPDAELWVAGGQREGIKPLAKRLSALGFGSPEARRIKRRTRVLVARRDGTEQPLPSLDALAQRFEAPAGNKRIQCVSLPGVFAHGRLDAGSALLLDALLGGEQRPKAKRVVDLGCGCGVLGLAVAAAVRKVTALTLVDIDAVAVNAAMRTVAANPVVSSVEGRTVQVLHRTASEVAAMLGARHDLVVSNAPFHDGHTADRTLMTRFADAARALCAPGGRFVLVANHHLPYRPLLVERFRSSRKLASDGRYVVYDAFA